jgi:hypothetical protein
MAGSTMFIIYTSGSGNNVTLSTRVGKGHSPPSVSQDIQATLLDGSGVVDGKMVANIKCMQEKALQDFKCLTSL